MSVRRIGAIVRWSACLMLALGVHATGAYALMTHWRADTDQIASAPAVLVDFAPLPAAPAEPTPLPPGPPQPQAEAPPAPQPLPVPVTAKTEEKQEEAPAAEKPVDIKTEPAPTTVTLPPPKPAPSRAEPKPRQRQASLASAPSAAEQRATRAVAAAPGASAHNPDALPSWRSALVAQIERYKRYPEEARSRGDQGVAQVAFSVDRNGGVHDARVVHSSGSSLLDRDALAWVARAQPLPPPPPELPGARVSVVVPLRYFFR